MARLGRYEVLSCIARGGMAEVDLACAHGTDGFRKLVALKRLLPEFCQDQQFVEMFVNEARLGAQLHHPNLVEIYEEDACDGVHFIAMELVHGVDMLALIRRAIQLHTDVPLQHALTVIARIAAGLHHAHESRDVDGVPLGLVHRDVSPRNIMIGFDGIPKLVDFGIAKRTEGECVEKTKVGVIKGKLAYMSPEQLDGTPADRRSDVYALSVVLWELTVGRRLFSGMSDGDLFRQVSQGRVIPPRAIKPDYPEGLQRIVLEGLARDRETRYPTAEHLMMALEAFAAETRLVLSERALGAYLKELFPERAGDPVSCSLQAWPELPHETLEPEAPLVLRPRRTRRLRAAAAILALLLVAMLGHVLARGRVHANPPSAPLPPLETAPATLMAAPEPARLCPAPRPRRMRRKAAPIVWDVNSPLLPKVRGDR